MSGLVGYICSVCGTSYEDRPASEPSPDPHKKAACRHTLSKMVARAATLNREVERRKQAFEHTWGEPFR